MVTACQESINNVLCVCLLFTLFTNQVIDGSRVPNTEPIANKAQKKRK